MRVGCFASRVAVTLALVAMGGGEVVAQPLDDDEGVRWSLYGLLKTDASVDSSPVNPGNFARWVEAADRVADHAHFNLTVRQTRLGIRATAPSGDGPDVSARLEVDFYGGGTENRNFLQLRHSYVQVQWESGWQVLAGQTSDLISPLVPRTVNYPVTWWAGNIGYRRPQVRVTRRVSVDSDRSFDLAVAASRTIGDSFSSEPGDSGVDSGRPTLQGRIGYAFGLAGRSAGIGVSGHWGEESLSADFGRTDLEFPSWSVNVDLALPLAPGLLLKAEAWRGRNLDDYLGAIGQGINLVEEHCLSARGGWASLEVDAAERLTLSAGAGLDDPDDGDLEPGARSHNRAIWVNGFYELTNELTAALEISHWRTQYLARPTGDALRVQTALSFSF